MVTEHREGGQNRVAAPSISTVRAVLLDFVERAGWTAGQVFFAVLLAGGTAVTVADLPWKYASTLALGAAVASVVLTALQYISKLKPQGFWPDLGIRLAKTFLASLSGSFIAAHPFDVTRFDWTTALNLAAVAVLTALGKGLLARGGDSSSAPAQASPSTLPTEVYRTAMTS